MPPGQNQVAVSELDPDYLEVICRVVGQSAALDFYTNKVWGLLGTFGRASPTR